uniref:Protein rolling stone n=1 Tax=Glossina brevipalpis TaxID=37001 RepID=A0A1A9WBX3_9MUSC
MMVSKLWKGCFPEITPEHVHRHNFYLCQWQRNTQVRIVYLFYRWLTAITCLAALVCSLLDIGRTEEHFENHYAKWWIYLTHWALLFCTLQAWLAAWIVTQGMMVEREDFELMRRAKKSRLHHIYWVLYTCATVYAFVVTMMYWGLVYDPEVHKIDTLNIMVHVLNSIIMLIDLAIVGHPIKLSHVYFTCGIGLAYGIFSGIYFLAGGTDRKNQVAIYPTMDWTKPGKAIITTVCSIIFVFIIHFTCFLLYRARVWLFTKLCIRTSNRRDGEMGDGLNDDSCTRLGGGSSIDYSHQQQYPTIHSEQPHRSHHTLSSSTTTIQCTAEHVYSTAPAHSVHQRQQQPLQATQQQQQQQQHGTHKTHHQHQYSAHHQYPPQYAGYQQQPVVAGVNVGVISTAEIYQTQDNKNKHQTVIGTGSSGVSGGGGSGGGGCEIGESSVNNSSLSRTVAQLDATQREQFLNPNKIMEFKM